LRRVLATMGAVALGTALSTVVASGTGAISAEAQNPEACQGVIGQAQVSPPAGYTEVINVEMTVANDEDSGFIGYWALDDYTKHIQVWEGPKGEDFYVAVMYQGTWQTFAGARSPENGTTEPSDGTGSIKGGYIATMTGPMLTSLAEPTQGTIGSYDYGGTQADILLGSYGNGQVGPPHVVDWQSFYFPPSTISTFNYAEGGNEWGWSYMGNSTSGPWCNTGFGSSGDIVTH
jgi:hypothetical protein